MKAAFCGFNDNSYEEIWKLKKVTSVCLVFFLALLFFTGTALADWPEYTGEMNDDFYVMLVDADSGRILYEHNSDEQIYPASTTKIMTCIVTLENASLDETVTIPAECDWRGRNGYSSLDIREGEEISMKDLLYGMMVVSGDDAADAIAIKVGGSIEGFVEMMNAKAKELGMDSSHFANAGGLDKEGPYVTVRDMAKLTVYAMKNPDFRDIVGRADYDMPETNKQNARTVDTTNKLLDPEEDYYYEYATGIKTGSTPKAGGCLVSSAAKDGMNLICLVYGESPSSKKQRWTISKELLEWGLDDFRTIDVSPLLGGPVQAQVQGYTIDDEMEGQLEFKLPEAGAAYVTLPKDAAQGLLDGTDSLEAVPAYDRELAAPVAE
jgi:D-alanyl-D-alanine carboxypeptidase (penicillin-binding protein 5/6)